VTRIWWETIRPKTLIAGASPVILGCALAFHDGSFQPAAAAVTLFCALMLQIGANFANDYFDFINGADTADRIGPRRALPNGLISKRQLVHGMAVVFSAALMSGAYLTVIGGRIIFFIGITSMVMAVFYTAGPVKLAYIGLGEAAAFLFFGPVAVTGTYYLQTGMVSREALLVSISPGLFALALLTVNNYRDREEDRRAGKRTLVVRYGAVFARTLYTATLISGFLVPCLLVFSERIGAAVCFIPLLAGASIPVLRKLRKQPPGRWLNKVLGATGLFEALVTAGLALALILG
jgi:1,4-dihydroxy-2-naphthoate polyprenyltransferase